MTVRFVELLALIALCSLFGWYVNSVGWVFVGCTAGSLLWLAWDTYRGYRVLDWIRSEEWSNEPAVPHLWAQMVERIRRLQKSLSGKARDSQ
ncbi:MAG: phosphate regulon sensor protein PhoR, partial [Burkholderiaceae bacterium]